MLQANLYIGFDLYTYTLLEKIMLRREGKQFIRYQIFIRFKGWKRLANMKDFVNKLAKYGRNTHD